MAKIIVISGPSGAGKGTLISRVLPLFDDVVLSISATTRSRRAGEREGREYFFLSRVEFLRRVRDGAFLEWAEYDGHLYGTPLKPVLAHLRSGKHVILEIELQGARQVLEREPDAAFIFIAPPDFEELEDRLRRRLTDTEAAIYRRLRRAREEMAELAGDSPQRPGHQRYVIVNRDVGTAAEELAAVITEIRESKPRGAKSA